MLASGIVDVEDIAKRIGNTVKVVQKYVTEFNSSVERLEKNDTKVDEQTARAARNTRGKDLMVTRTQGKKNKGVTIMTHEASSYGDDARRKGPARSRTSRGTIFNMETGEVE